MIDTTGMIIMGVYFGAIGALVGYLIYSEFYKSSELKKRSEAMGTINPGDKFIA
jgi:hypothetical protein